MRSMRRRDNAPTVKSEALHVKYRPKRLSEVIGHRSIVKSLTSLVESRTVVHTFLFTGSSGVGKTTLARITANMFGCSEQNIIEIDAAVNSGVDDMRTVLESLQFKGLGTTENKMLIIDECHMLSKSAWGALLKITEEPPSHVFFAMCTTELDKVPATIITRSTHYDLKPVGATDIGKLLDYIIQEEGLEADDTIIDLVIDSANGSVRNAINMLAKVAGISDVEEAASIIDTVASDKEIVDLCRLLVSDSLSWKAVQDTVKSMKDVNPETVRIVVVNYLVACLLGARSDKEVPRLLDMLHVFSKPCNPSEKWGPVLLAFGNFIF